MDRVKGWGIKGNECLKNKGVVGLVSDWLEFDEDIVEYGVS